MHNADDMTHERCIMEKIIDPMEWGEKDLESSDFKFFPIVDTRQSLFLHIVNAHTYFPSNLMDIIW